MRSTLIDIAREAGVSSATVDRVLNNRPGVRTRTREVVTEVARRMGYIASNGGVAPADDTRLAFDFVLPAGTNSFIEELRQQLHQQGNALRDITATVHSIEGFNPFTLAEKLKELEGRSSGVGVVGIDHPAVREAMRSLAKSGTPVITLISDIHHVPRAGYVGIDDSEVLAQLQPGAESVPEALQVVEMGGRGTDRQETMVTETLIRAFYAFYRERMGL